MSGKHRHGGCDEVVPHPREGHGCEHRLAVRIEPDCLTTHEVQCVSHVRRVATYLGMVTQPSRCEEAVATRWYVVGWHYLEVGNGLPCHEGGEVDITYHCDGCATLCRVGAHSALVCCGVVYPEELPSVL